MIKVRAIEIKDIDQVYNHTCFLANNSGVLEPDFVLTKNRMRKDLFCTENNWHGLVVTDGTEIIGSCLYGFVNTNRPFNQTSCLFLDTLFIESMYRKQGIGRLLMNELIQIAKNNQLTRIEFWCLKNNIVANEFYIELGATTVDKLNVYNLNV